MKVRLKQALVYILGLAMGVLIISQAYPQTSYAYHLYLRPGMGILKKSPPAGQSIDMRSFHQGMPPQATDPVILVVDGNKQDIRLFGSLQNVRKGQHQQHA